MDSDCESGKAGGDIVIEVVDSFIEYLNSELSGDLEVNWVRVSADENSNRPKLNALNVAVLSFHEYDSLEEVLISLDLIGTDERTVLGWAARVRNVLLQVQFTRLKVFTPDPDAPSVTDQMVSWNGNKVRFTVVVSDENSCHLNGTLPVCHART
jgi:hypothetical protein